MKKDIFKKDYVELFETIKNRIRKAQYDALRAVNREMIILYLDIGKAIVERQADDKYGKAVVEALSQDLQKEFLGMAGFSARNIWYMRLFYLYCQKNQKLQPLVAEISWTHNLIII